MPDVPSVLVRSRNMNKGLVNVFIAETKKKHSSQRHVTQPRSSDAPIVLSLDASRRCELNIKCSNKCSNKHLIIGSVYHILGFSIHIFFHYGSFKRTLKNEPDALANCTIMAIGIGSTMHTVKATPMTCEYVGQS